MRPKELLQLWVKAFNRGDVDEIASLYLEDAKNHQVAQDPVVGRTAIREMFAREFSTAKMVCIIEAMYEDGDVGILEWKDPIGLRGCGFPSPSPRQLRQRPAPKLVSARVLPK